MRIERERVGDVLQLQRRSVDVDPAAEYAEIGVRSFGKGIFHKSPVVGSDLGNKRVFWIEPGDLVLSNVFAWEGAIAVASCSDAGRIGSHRFMTYTPKNDRIDLSWAAWFFLSGPGLTLIRSASPGSAGRNRTLAIGRFENLEIPLPPIEEQRRVAARLDRIREGAVSLGEKQDRRAGLGAVLPLAILSELDDRVRLQPRRLNEVLRPVRNAVNIDPTSTYVTIGIRSFGKGIFHYPARTGSEMGKLRFHDVPAGVLAVSNIKGWEGAVATTSVADSRAVASNRFLFFEPAAGPAAADYFWAKLLTSDGLLALGHASPGSADRNRTLAVDRFLQIELQLPGGADQVAIGRRIQATRELLGRLGHKSAVMAARGDALLPSALNAAFADLS